MREAIVYQPEDRRIIERNLYCPYCGNTNQWQIDLRLWHNVQIESSEFSVALDPDRTKEVLTAINRHIDRMASLSSESNKPFLHCANCSNAALDMHEQMLEMCYNTGCPGCFHCGNWIDEDDLRETCASCIKDNDGTVDEDHCFSMCPHYDYGLEDVRQHYAITLQELIHAAGYDDS